LHRPALVLPPSHLLGALSLTYHCRTVRA
jgi:hypothetical protein